MSEAADGGDGPRAAPKSKRLQQTQAQVDEVVDIMKMNIDKVLERDQKLSQLDDRADALQEGASQFEKSAGTLKNKMMWKNMKMIIIMVVIGIVVLFMAYMYMGGDLPENPIKDRDESAPPASPPAAPNNVAPKTDAKGDGGE